MVSGDGHRLPPLLPGHCRPQHLRPVLGVGRHRPGRLLHAIREHGSAVHGHKVAAGDLERVSLER